MRLALWSEVLDEVRAAIDRVRDVDDALRFTRTLERLASCPLAFVRSMRAAARRLPRASAEHHRPETAIRRHFVSFEEPGALRC